MTQDTTPNTAKLAALFESENASVRLQAALTAGTLGTPDLLDPLINQCAIEADFAVREMLTWALLRLPRELVLPRVMREVQPQTATSELGQAQGLHTLSKLGDTRAWPAITAALLHHTNSEIARTAWRAAVSSVPNDHVHWLARELAAELGRGDRDLRRSLSRALIALGEAGEDAVREAVDAYTPASAAAALSHAHTTLQAFADPDAGFAYDLDEATRTGIAHSGTPRAHR